MSIVIRIVVALLGLGAVAGLGAWGYRTIYDAGLTAGRAEIQAKWDADKIAVQKLAAEAAAENAAKLEAATQLNQETVDAYKAQADAAVADATDYAHRLHDAEVRLAASSRAVPDAPSQPGAAPAPQASGPGQLDAAVGARLAECASNEAQLTALQAEIAPQLARAPP